MSILCGILLAVSNPSTTNESTRRGSVTKVTTGVGILRLANEGKIKLTDAIPQHIDPFLAKCKQADPSLNYTSLSDLFGPDVSKVTVRDLLSMRSGIPDFDTANPGRNPTDSLRATLYKVPNLCDVTGPL